jgi:signal transduction histidine kinase
MKDKTAASPAYRKVVADLQNCEERYQTLVDSMDVPDDARLKATLATLKSEVSQRRRLEAELLTVLEAERQRIGQDLHDDLCQQLAAAALTSSVIAKQIRHQNPEMSAELDKLPKLLNDTIESCRTIVRGLHPITLGAKGLPAALEELASRMPNKVKFVWPRGDRINLEPAAALHTYRIIEEAVGNAIKHARPKNIAVELSIVGERAIVVISDDGRGFDVSSVKKGMGLPNMQYRASVIGAELTIRAREGGGTCVHCHLPLPR